MFHYQASSLLLLQEVPKRSRALLWAAPRGACSGLCSHSPSWVCTELPCSIIHISRRSGGSWLLWEVCPLQGSLSMEGSPGIPFPWVGSGSDTSGRAQKPWVHPESLILWNKTSPWLHWNHFLLTPVQIRAGAALQTLNYSLCLQQGSLRYPGSLIYDITGWESQEETSYN